MEARQMDERTKRPTWLTDTDSGRVRREEGVKMPSQAKTGLWGTGDVSAKGAEGSWGEQRDRRSLRDNNEEF